MATHEQEALTNRLEIALGFGAGLWLALLVIGFVAPGGWHWGWQGSIGHMINYMISLWLVALVLCPLLAMRDPLRNTAAIQVYLLGLVAIIVSSIRAEHPELASDGLPIIIALLSMGIVLWSHPRRSLLWQW